MSSFVHDTHRRRTLLCILCSVWPHRSVLFVRGLSVSTLLCCWCCAVTLTVVSVHGAHVHIVDIPTSISMKWELDPECPSSDCSHEVSHSSPPVSVPLRQVGSSTVWDEGMIVLHEGKLRGASEDMHVATCCATISLCTIASEA